MVFKNQENSELLLDLIQFPPCNKAPAAHFNYSSHCITWPSLSSCGQEQRPGLERGEKTSYQTRFQISIPSGTCFDEYFLLGLCFPNAPMRVLLSVSVFPVAVILRGAVVCCRPRTAASFIHTQRNFSQVGAFCFNFQCEGACTKTHFPVVS